jgi:RhoGEF domain
VAVVALQEVERKPESRKLEINGYLTKPTTRLGRYNLLLGEILKHTPEGHSDCELIRKAMDTITGYLRRLNSESGNAKNKFDLQQLHDNLSFKNKSDEMVSILSLAVEALMKR